MKKLICVRSGCLALDISQLLQLKLPYNSYRTCLTNRLESILHHIMPLVINSLGGGHTHANTHIHMQTIRTGSILETRRVQACGVRAPGLKTCVVIYLSALVILIQHCPLFQFLLLASKKYSEKLTLRKHLDLITFLLGS